jgi:hypothetical protein
MDMKISFISTSMIGFEYVWTSIFMTLQIGIALSTLPLDVADVRVNSG